MSETNGRKAPPDILDATDDWLFLCLDGEMAAAVARCTERGLETEVYSASTVKRVVKKQKVIVVSPSSGSGRKDAIDVADRCRIAGASVVREWVLLGLGAEYPTLGEWIEAFDMGTTLWADRPWMEGLSHRLSGLIAPQPSSNGNGKNGHINYGQLSNEELGLISASKVKPAKIDWLWEYHLARREMALMAAEGGSGKSMILLGCAAAVSTGGLWPDKKNNAPVGHVIIVSAEDDADTTLRPRLQAMGANLERIEFCKARVIMERDGEKLVDPKSLQDHAYWKAVLDRFPETVLLIVDPLPSYLGRGVNDRQNSEIRAVLEPFIEDVIRPRSICFYVDTHLNKTLDARSAAQRITGSIAYVNIPRNVHIIVRDPEQPDRRFFKQCKCNNAPDDLPAVAFRIETKVIDFEGKQIETAIPIFEDVLHAIDLNRLINGDKGQRGPKPVKSSRLAEWLWTEMQDGKQVWMGTLVDRARDKDLLSSPTATDKKPSISPLYHARDRIPELHPGWVIQEETRDMDGAKNPRKFWQLIPEDEVIDATAEQDDTPF